MARITERLVVGGFTGSATALVLVVLVGCEPGDTGGPVLGPETLWTPLTWYWDGGPPSAGDSIAIGAVDEAKKIGILVGGWAGHDAYMPDPWVVLLTAPFEGGALDEEESARFVQFEAGGDGSYGSFSAVGGDLTGNGTPDAALYDGWDVIVFDGPFAGEVPRESASAVISYSGYSTMTLADLDGDGATDLLCGNGIAYGPLEGERALDVTWPHDSSSTHHATSGDLDGDGTQVIALEYDGLLFIFDGDLPPGEVDPPAVARASWNPPMIDALLSGHDLTGDGRDDLLIAGGRTKPGGYWHTYVWLLDDPTGEPGAPGSFMYESLTVHMEDDTPLAVGDFDGDGQADLAVGRQSRDSVLVFLGPLLPGTFDELDADAWLVGEEGFECIPSEDCRIDNPLCCYSPVDDSFGRSLAAGDLDGDGRDDLVIGAPGDPMEISGGRVYVAWGGGV